MLVMEIAGGILLAFFVLWFGAWICAKARDVFYWFYKDGYYYYDRDRR